MKYGTVGMKQYLKVAAVLAFLLCTGVATATPCTPSLSRQVIWVDQSFLTCIPLSAFFLMAPKANGKAKGKAKGKARGKQERKRGPTSIPPGLNYCYCYCYCHYYHYHYHHYRYHYHTYHYHYHYLLPLPLLALPLLPLPLLQLPLLPLPLLPLPLLQLPAQETKDAWHWLGIRVNANWGGRVIPCFAGTTQANSLTEPSLPKKRMKSLPPKIFLPKTSSDLEAEGKEKDEGMALVPQWREELPFFS